MTAATPLKTILDSTGAAIGFVPELATDHVNANCELVGVHETEIHLNGFELTADQPAMRGGTAHGPTPAELVLAALGSSHVQTYRIWSELLDIPFDDVMVDLQADVDIRGTLGLRDGIRPGFGGVSLSVRISGPESKERYDELQKAVDDHSPVLDIFANPVQVSTTQAMVPTERSPRS